MREEIIVAMLACFLSPVGQLSTRAGRIGPLAGWLPVFTLRLLSLNIYLEHRVYSVGVSTLYYCICYTGYKQAIDYITSFA